MKTPCYQPQAFAAWWCLDQRLRKTNNSICGDEMGLGKTPIALMYWLLWVLLDGMYEEVDKSRQARDGNHLPLDSPVGSKCPSATTSKYGFECSCVLGISASIWQENYLSEHHAAKVPLNILPFLFIVKSATVQKWCNEFTKFIDPSVAPLRLIPAYHGIDKSWPWQWTRYKDKLWPPNDSEKRCHYAVVTSEKSFWT